ncbi:MAG: histidinol dehydrogenase, partial [Rhizobiaceae bacterium]
MVQKLNTSDVNFDDDFAALLASKREVSEDVDRVVQDVIAEVRKRGDAALIDYCKKFDRLDLTPSTLAISAAEIDAAVASADPAIVQALQLARDRIESHHKRQMPKDDRYVDPIGVELGSRWTAI